MKKLTGIAAVCLAALLLLTLSACGKTEETAKTPETPEVKESGEAADQTEPEKEEPKPEYDYANLEGSYFDGVSQRASADVKDQGNGVEISIHWASTLSDFSGWTMHAVYEGGRLVYRDCVKTNSGLNESGELASEVEYENGEGYFEIADGALKWTGAAEERCVDCIFEKYGAD